MVQDLVPFRENEKVARNPGLQKLSRQNKHLEGFPPNRRSLARILQAYKTSKNSFLLKKKPTAFFAGWFLF
ncbi:MAG: hypothetical protein AMK69_01425 [Nitrospira bacterium SG8_3]|nr:MAG: hypothetical protein AMK69_01425 [Nitrospira bacterium SG8_3]